MVALLGHDGDCSHTDWSVRATFDTREQAEQFIQSCLIPGKSPNDIWPYQEGSLIWSCIEVKIQDDYHSDIPHNPSPFGE